MKPVLSTEKTRVLKTNDLSIFNMQEDLSISKTHLNKIKNSIVKKNLTPDYPILVDDEYRILDGKYRFLSCYELKLPVFYKVAEVTTFVDAVSIKHLHRNLPLKEIIQVYHQNSNYGNMIEMFREYKEEISYRNILDTIRWTDTRYDKTNFYDGDFSEWDVDLFKKRVSRVKQIDAYFGLNHYRAALKACIRYFGIDDRNNRFDKQKMSALKRYSENFQCYGNDGGFENEIHNFLNIIAQLPTVTKEKIIMPAQYKIYEKIGVRLKNKQFPEELMPLWEEYCWYLTNEIDVNFTSKNFDEVRENFKVDLLNRYETGELDMYKVQSTIDKIKQKREEFNDNFEKAWNRAN